MFAINITNLNTLKYHICLSIFYRKCGHEYKKYLKTKDQLKY